MPSGATRHRARPPSSPHRLCSLPSATPPSHAPLQRHPAPTNEAVSGQQTPLLDLPVQAAGGLRD